MTGRCTAGAAGRPAGRTPSARRTSAPSAIQRLSRSISPAPSRCAALPRRHPQRFVFLGDAARSARWPRAPPARSPPRRRELGHGRLAAVEPQPLGPVRLVLPVAGEAVLRQDRPDLAVEITPRGGPATARSASRPSPPSANPPKSSREIRYPCGRSQSLIDWAPSVRWADGAGPLPEGRTGAAWVERRRGESADPDLRPCGQLRTVPLVL